MITVIGTIFVDCKGFSHNTFDPRGRNLGDVKFIHGGVGRNVAETLANLNMPVAFVSTVDDSGIGQEVVARLRKARVDTGQLLPAASLGMGFWLAVMDEQGELAGAISQMPNLTALEDFIVEQGQAVSERSSHIVLELDLSASITRSVIRLAKAARRPVYGIPGNLSVIVDNRDILSELDLFICNDIEAAKLLKTTLDRNNPEQLLNSLIAFVAAQGMKSMVVTLGDQGAVYYDASNNQFGHQPCFAVEVVDTSGAGDAFFAGTVMGLVTGRSLQQSVVFGSKVASCTIQVTENTCQDLTAIINFQTGKVI